MYLHYHNLQWFTVRCCNKLVTNADICKTVLSILFIVFAACWKPVTESLVIFEIFTAFGLFRDIFSPSCSLSFDWSSIDVQITVSWHIAVYQYYCAVDVYIADVTTTEGHAAAVVIRQPTFQHAVKMSLTNWWTSCRVLSVLWRMYQLNSSAF